MKKEEKDSRKKVRELSGIPAKIVLVVSVLFSLFYLYTSGFSLFSSESHRGMYFLFTLVLCFLMFPAFKGGNSKRFTVADVLLALSSIAVIGYWIIMYPDYATRIGNPNISDIILGALIILLSLEVARRVVGLVLPIMALVFIAYAYLGPYVPGMLGHYGFGTSRIMEYIGVGMGGVWGVVVNTYATYIFPFIIFASFLQAAGGGEAIEKIATSVAGGSRGGPAKIAVISSGLIGSITGSSAANAVMTGAYTIPLMKKLGYRAHTAAGIEAAASTGGQFMPPIMGAAAFLIAAFTQTPYLEIVKISIIPAFLYFLGVGMMVHFIAARRGIKGLAKENIPAFGRTFMKEGYLLLPIVIILVLIVAGYSPQLAAFWSVISTIALSYFRPEHRMTPKRIIEALRAGAKSSLAVGATAGVIGIIMAVVTMTGLGVKFSSFIISLSGGILPLTIFFIAVGGYFIGMGVTITATYILLAILAVPALVTLGVGLIPAHLVVFWFCNTGGITPPVALVAFAASSIADCSPMKAGFAALRLASPLFIIPFLFVYTPILLNGPVFEVVLTVISSIIAIIAYAGMMQGYWLRVASVLHRILLGAGAVLLFIPNIYADIAGLVVLAVVTVINLKADESKLTTQEW